MNHQEILYSAGEKVRCPLAHFLTLPLSMLTVRAPPSAQFVYWYLMAKLAPLTLIEMLDTPFPR